MTYANPCKATQAYVSSITILHNDKFFDENTIFYNMQQNYKLYEVFSKSKCHIVNFEFTTGWV